MHNETYKRVYSVSVILQSSSSIDRHWWHHLGSVAGPETTGTHVHIDVLDIADASVTRGRVVITAEAAAGGHVLCAFDLTSTHGDHMCPRVVSLSALLGATVTVVFGGGSIYDVQGASG